MTRVKTCSNSFCVEVGREILLEVIASIRKNRPNPVDHEAGSKSLQRRKGETLIGEPPNKRSHQSLSCILCIEAPA